MVAERASPRRLVLLRHGRTAWNALGRAQGLHDEELDEVGHAQAADVAPYLAAMRPAAIWTSDLARARATTAYVERATGLTAVVDARLREYDVGARQGMTPAELEASFPEAHRRWRDGDDLVPVPGAEPPAEVAARIVPALRECLDALAEGATGLVVAHGASLKVGLVGLLGWPLPQAVQLRSLPNCGWVVVSRATTTGRPRLETYGGRVHETRPDFASPEAVG